MFLFLLAGTCGVRAGLRVPPIIGDGMVLQQRSAASLWGWADPGARIEVSTSWDGVTVRTEADGAGCWRVVVQTPQADAAGSRITIADGRTTLSFSDVLIGEVWFCAGQSNMEMPLDGFWNQPVEGANADIARAGCFPGIRMATIPRAPASVPQEETGGGWQTCTSETAPRFSATAFYFARMLNEALGVPVGIIQCSWGGTKIESWMPRELLTGCGDAEPTGTGGAPRPTAIYNGMVYPLRHYTIRGFVWYQGCSNVGAHETYAARQAAMAAHWRELWGLGELPFYFVEIAPYRYGSDDAGARLREAQHLAAKLIPGGGIVSTADLVKPYERDCIHPSRKREVGERLAFMALNRAYGRYGVACDSPVFREMELADDGTAVLAFDHADAGFTSAGPLEGFEAAGADRVFRPAKATLLAEERKIRVSLPGGVSVVAVRYCFHDWAPAGIWNCRGLPLMPFRTDDWR